jgi:hypothetical protein
MERGPTMLTTNDPGQGSGTGESMLLTVILKHDQTMTFESIRKHLETTGFWKQSDSVETQPWKGVQPCF